MKRAIGHLLQELLVVAASAAIAHLLSKPPLAGQPDPQLDFQTQIDLQAQLAEIHGQLSVIREQLQDLEPRPRRRTPDPNSPPDPSS